MKQRKKYVLPLLATILITSCGTSIVTARNVTHPVMLGKYRAIGGQPDKDGNGEAFTISVIEENKTYFVTTQAQYENPGKVDVEILKRIVSEKDQVFCDEIKYTNYSFYALFAIGMESNATISCKIKRGGKQ